jgi:hypothetical protein
MILAMAGTLGGACRVGTRVYSLKVSALDFNSALHRS